MNQDNKKGGLAPSPTSEFYGSLEVAFDHFNRELFEGRLPRCLITLRSSNRIYGYHHTDRFIAQNGDLLDELGLNPGFFAIRPLEVTLSTLVHEMVHHWQSHFGTPTVSNPHNAEWAAKMQAIGLTPSDTGLPGGKQNGKKVTHFIQPDGLFIQSCKRLVEGGYQLKWFDRNAPAEHDRYEKQAEELAKHDIKVELSEPPIHEITAPKSTKPQASGSVPKVTIYNPPLKKEQKRIRMWCCECGSKITLFTKLHLICGTCRIDFEVFSKPIKPGED